MKNSQHHELYLLVFIVFNHHHETTTVMSTTVYFFLEHHHLYSDSSCTQASTYSPLIHPALLLVHSSYSSANQQNQSIAAVADVPRSSSAPKSHIYSVPLVSLDPHHWLSLCVVVVVVVVLLLVVVVCGVPWSRCDRYATKLQQVPGTCFPSILYYIDYSSILS